MKKFKVTIPAPCHENWEAMTPQDKGRFCGSCQKTVIDFSTMSDRQLAEFFRKPAGSVCGRFHQDQLHRDIMVPRKRIPWVKYFFQFTWPAFVLFLKSCGQKMEVQGTPLVENTADKQHVPESPPMIGLMLPKITPVDTVQAIGSATDKPEQDTSISEGVVPAMGETVGEIKIAPAPPQVEEYFEKINIMDTVVVTSEQSYFLGKMIAGGISIVSSDKPVPEEDVEEEKGKEDLTIKAYPNPVKKGAQLTIDAMFTDDEISQIRLYSSIGQFIVAQQGSFGKNKSYTFTIPSNLTAGTYFVHLTTKKKQSKTATIVVTN